MPKEVIRENQKKNTGPHIDIRWGRDHFDTVMLKVDRETPFVFVDKNGEPLDDGGDPFSKVPGTYTGLAFYFEDEDQVDKLIWTLKRAKKKVFRSA